LNISLDELNAQISGLATIQDNYKKFDDRLYKLLDRHYQGAINEISFFHLSRRLKGTEHNVDGRNLYDLLTTKNEYTDFLEKYNIKFDANEQRIDVIYQGNRIDWDNCHSGNPSSIKYRLGCFENTKDYCFNGLAFKDHINKSSYAISLSSGPEFFHRLFDCLNRRDILSCYIENSTYYCYEYCIPIHKVIFDGTNIYADDNEYLIMKKVVNWLISYYYDSSSHFYSENPVLRLPDNEILDGKFFVAKESLFN